MSLPTIAHPTFYITIPSTQKKVKFRRYLAGEEKILLIAKQSEEERAVTDAVIEICNACALEPFNALEHKPYDLDYVFLKLRAQSVDNIAKIKFIDEADDEKEHDFDINLDLVTIDVPAISKTVRVNEQITVVVEHPTNAQMLAISDLGELSATDLQELIVGASIKRVVDDQGEEHQADSEEEVIEWIRTFPGSVYQEICDFINQMPQITHTIKYKNSEDKQCEVVLTGIYDFFTL